MYKYRPSVSSPSLMVTGKRILRVSLELYISGNYSVGNNLHALFSFVGRVAAITSLVFIVVEDDDFAESVLDLITLFTSLISPLLEFGKRHVLDLLASFHPRAGLEHLVIICIHVTNVCDNSKLYSASQRELFCVTYSVCALSNVSK